MARARNIKPGFFTNELLAELPFETRLLFIGLWTLADREGRLDDRPKRIRAQLFPYDDCLNMEGMLGALASAGFLVRYEVDGQRYAQIVNFTKHQMPHHKEVASEIPPPPGMPAITRHAYDVTKEQREAIFARDERQCLKCGATDNLTIDHVIPLSKGGDNSEENLQTLCFRCNSSKGDATKSYRKNVDVETTERSNYKQHSTLGQRKANVDDPCPTDSLIPDSLQSDSGLPPAEATRVARDEARAVTAADLSIAMRKAGVQATPADPRVIALAAQGVTPETATAACEEAKRSKPNESIGIGYVAKILERWASDAANLKANGAAMPRASPGYQTPNDKAKAFADRLTGRARNDQPRTIIDINEPPSATRALG